MKLLVTGANGLVGSHFTQNYNPKENILSPSLEELDITNKKSVGEFFGSHQSDAVIHFAAFTDVSLAEEQRDNKKAPCWIINVDGTYNLVHAVNPKNYFIHISTDVIFQGSKEDPGPYPENHPPANNPNLLSWYGWTKREAEKVVADNMENYAILRISNPVRAVFEQKTDYVRKILKLYDEDKLYPMFSDQYLTLTYINEVTKVLQILLEKRQTGIFHTSSSNVFTPFKLVTYLIEKVRGAKNAVQPATIEHFLKNNPLRYPQHGGLKVKKTEDALGLKFMTWEEIIDDLAKQL